MYFGVQTCRKDADCSENDFLFHEFFFVWLLVFEIWSILCMVDFDVFDLIMQKTEGSFFKTDSDANLWG